MEEELDLRPYLGALLQKWWLIVGAGILFGLLAIAAAGLRPDSYEASALVTVLEPSQEVQFDPRFVNVPTRNTLLKAYPEIARSDEILQVLLSQVEGTDAMTVPQLRGLLTAEAGNEPSLMYFRANHGDPTVAAELANAWAALFVERANGIYGAGNGDSLAFYEDQLLDARTRLQGSEQRLIDFQSVNRLSIATNNLDSLNSLQMSYLASRNTLSLLLDDIAAHQQQIGSGTADTTQLSEQLTALSLQGRAYSIQGALPVLLQIDAADIADQTIQQQRDYLDALSTSVEDRIAQFDQQLQELEPQILALQVEKQQIMAEGTALQLDRDLLEETFTALTRKVDEEIITTQDTSSGFRLASRASLPSQPAGTSPLVLAVLGGAFGVVLASLVIIIKTWWRS